MGGSCPIKMAMATIAPFHRRLSGNAVTKHSCKAFLLYAVTAVTVHRAGFTRGSLDLSEGVFIFPNGGTMNLLLVDRFGLVDLELGLESLKIVGQDITVGMAASVRVVDLILGHVVTWVTPIASTGTTFLRLGGIDAFKPVLREELGKVVVTARMHSAFCEALVILVVELMRSSHIGGLCTGKYLLYV